MWVRWWYLAGGLALAACGRIGFDPAETTTLQLTVDGPVAVAELHGQIALAPLDPDALYALPSGSLPVTGELPLGGATGMAHVIATARDTSGRTLQGSADVEIGGGEARVTIVLGDRLAGTCFDGARDGDETDVDCGGSCAACPVGGSCKDVADCATGRCFATACEPADLRWTMVAPLPDVRIGVSAVLDLDDQLLVFGGAVDDGQPGRAATYRYDDAGDAWVAGPPMVMPRQRGAATIDRNGTAYLLGGNDGGGVRSVVSQLARGGVAWTAGPSLSSSRDSMAAALSPDGTVLISGGYTGTAPVATVEALVGGQWVARQALPRARTNVAAAVLPDGRIAIVGGHDGSMSMFYGDVDAYDAQADAWSALPTLHHPRSDLAAVVAPDRRLYVLGGYANNAVTFVEALRANGPWLDLPPTKLARDACAAAIGADGRIYMIGGRDAVAFAEVEVYGPRLVLDRASASPGESIVAHGTGFAASAAVTVFVDGTPVEAATADAAGAFSATFVMPAIGAGRHTITAVDAAAGYPARRTLAVP